MPFARKKTSIGENVILLLIFIAIIQIIAVKVMGKSSPVFLGYLDEFLCLVFLVSFLFLSKSNRLFNVNNIRSFTIFYILFLLCGIVSLILFPKYSTISQAILQLFLDSKFLILVLFLLQLSYTDKLLIIAHKFFKYILIINIPFFLLQFLDPSLFNSIFDSDASSGLFHTQAGNLPRAVGIFWHPSQLAAFGAFAVFYFTFINRSKYLLILSWIELIVSFQRQEVVTVLFLTIIFSYNIREIILKPRNLVILVCLIIFTVVFFDPIYNFIQFNIALMSLNDISQSGDSRVVFYLKSIGLANAHFPFGTGLGSFGGYAAKLFKSHIYNQLNFTDYWWYNNDLFLTDDYYPHILGEFGYLGLSFLLISFYKFIAVLKKVFHFKSNRNMCVACTVYILLVCLTSPVMNDFFSTLMLIMCIIISLVNDSVQINFNRVLFAKPVPAIKRVSNYQFSTKVFANGTKR